MLGGRPKVGQPDINWMLQSMVKRRRRTFGFGSFDTTREEYEREVYVREMSVADGGLGAAVWDAGIILARWAYDNRTLWPGKRVLELGSGCSVPGLVIGRYAAETYLTDYLDGILDNLVYLVDLNTRVDDSDDDGSDDDATDAHTKALNAEKRWMKQRMHVRRLDWTSVANDTYGKDACTGYDEPVPVCDVIVGSELTYSLLNVDDLIAVLERFLAPGGTFYEILSDDRDGVAVFLQRIQERGWSHKAERFPDHLLGNYGSWQRPETYQLYTFRRVSDQEE